MTINKWFVTVILGFILGSIITAQTSKTVLIGGKIAFGLGTSLNLEKIRISGTEVECYFFFRNTHRAPRGNLFDGVYDRICSLSGAYTDNYNNARVSGISFGRNYTLEGAEEKRFSITIIRPANTLHLSGINLGGHSKNATLKLSKNYGGNYGDFDLSGAIATVPYKKKTVITKSAESKDSKKPVILISSPTFTQAIFRTDEFAVTISGTAKDNIGIATVSVNGKAASLKSDGRFQKRLKLKFGKNPIVISAVDINDNKADIRFTIIREEIIEDDEFSDVDFAPETGKPNRNGVAVVIGIEEYLYAPSVTYAYNDADIFREYLIKTFGYKRENIYFKVDDRATKGEFEKIFSRNGWLANNSTNQSEIIIFYAGHGAPELDSKSSYLIPYDIDPNYATTGYALADLYANLGSLKAKSITVVLDACFSGGSRDNQSLLSDSRPIYISVEEEQVPKNTMVFSAASGTEISSGYKAKIHGLYTYYFLKGLNGDADKNGDRKITYSEMHEFVADQVSTQAKKMGREQHPQLLGEGTNKVLLTY